MSWRVHVVVLAALAGCSAPMQPGGASGAMPP